jgi:Undecaprenyl-phosphate glucose phosphotransferase
MRRTVRGARCWEHDVKKPTFEPADTGASTVHYPYTPDMVPGVTILVDAAVIALAALGAYLVVVARLTPESGYYVFCVVFVTLCYLALGQRAGFYAIRTIMQPFSRADDVLIAQITSFFLFLSVVVALDNLDYFSMRWLVYFFCASTAGLIAMRILLFVALRMLSGRGVLGRTMVVLGTGAQASRFITRLATAKPYFSSMVGVFGVDHEHLPKTFEDHPVLGGLDDLLSYARRQKIDDVVVALPWNANRNVTATIEKLKELPVNVYLSSDLVGYDLAFRPVATQFAALPMFEVVQKPISGWSYALKTLEDLVLTSIALLLISPVLILIAVAIKLDSPGPVFFMQQRLGFNNKPFSIYKFRSMHHRESSETVVRQATKRDPRVTRVGRFIRATSLDELPQLLNVLDGTMSLVGPRPHALSHNEEYGAQIRGYFARHRVKPGITGWAQVKGLRGETEALELMEARIQHDIYYAENWSLFLDLRILLMTAFVVFFQKSAY